MDGTHADGAQSRVRNGKEERQERHPVVGRGGAMHRPDTQARTDNEEGKGGHDNANRDDGFVLRLGVDVCGCVGDKCHSGLQE